MSSGLDGRKGHKINCYIASPDSLSSSYRAARRDESAAVLSLGPEPEPEPEKRKIFGGALHWPTSQKGRSPTGHVSAGLDFSMYIMLARPPGVLEIREQIAGHFFTMRNKA
jgi:hypothetical protein